MAGNYTTRKIAMLFGVVSLGLGVTYYTLDDMREAAVTPTGPVVGDVTYWKEAAETKARVIRHGAPPLIMEGLQGTEPVTGVLITTLRFADCGVIKFERQALGSSFASAKAGDTSSTPNCPIKDWSGMWRIGSLGS